MFSGANTGRKNASFVVLGIPLDVTTSHRGGTRKAPQRIREASRSFETYIREADTDILKAGVHDTGDIDVWNSPRETVEFTEGVVKDVSQDGAVPLLLGGEHTVSFAGFRGTDADTVVVFDAHLDLKDEYEGTQYSHACVTRRAVEKGCEVYIVGAREGSREEWEYAEENDSVTVLGVDEVTEIDPGEPYVSVDVDIFDPGYASGVGTPVPFGENPAKLRDAVRELAPDAVGFDVVEACPAYGENACYFGAALMREFIGFAADAD